ncbi:hypothetical protein BKA63DRAFT_196923 [Paraphoma chrysanthemicola]|nr:hypothetical protein BKA63DRAFT_528444 [Paraphoma chrysanthemicola]KAH7061837.1 hypothetical protein BKA63DRAFT_196923 [Paraphoma chrysanthemicola]
MKLFMSCIVGASLLLKASAACKDIESSEQYCLLNAGGSLLFNDDPVPTVTIIYRDTTTTTTLAAFTNCGDGRGTLPASSSGGSPASPTASRNTVGVQTSASGFGDSQSAGVNPIASGLSAQQPLSVSSAASVSVEAVTQKTTPTESNVVAPLNPTASLGSGVNTNSALAGASQNPQALTPSPRPAISAGGNAFGSESGASVSAASNQRASGSGSVHDSNALAAATSSGAESLLTTSSMRVFATPSALSSANPLLPSETAGSRNSTLTLSSAAVDALQLAQFLKNLGVSVFNSSYQVNGSMASDGRNSTSLAGLIANISLQERTQQDTLLRMLHRAGSLVVPPCEYELPASVLERSLLMGALKSVEGGVFMSLAESLASEDTAAAITLSSIAGVAASQNAVLRAQANLNISIASFETPLSETWAYNFALKYVRPGSCVVELPIPILPTLSINGEVSAYVRANSNVTLAWDAAAQAAASRSGKTLHIGWVNQVDNPVYTSVLVMGNGRGRVQVPPGLAGTAIAVLTAQPGLAGIEDLTEATLAGPVVVNLTP